MRKTIVLLLAVLLFAKVSAQKVWFREDFDESDGQWTTALNDQYLNLIIENGHYIFDNQDDRGNIRWVERNIFMSDTKDYSFSVKMKINSIKSGNGVGIHITTNDGKRIFFIIDPTVNKFWIGHMTPDSEWESYMSSSNGWKKTKVINQNGEYNELSIVRIKDKINFLINDKSVLNLNGNKHLSRIRGSMGIVAFTEANFSVDYIEFDQDNWGDVLMPSSKQLKAVSLKSVNTTASENGPVLTADSKTLFFSRSRYEGNMEGKIESVTEGNDIYVSHYVDDNWTEPMNLGSPVNDKNNNFLSSVSPDGNSILVIGKYKGDKRAPHISNRTTSGWSQPEPLNIDDFYSLSDFETYFMATDWKTLILAIERSDSYGSSDFYVSFRQEDGSFSAPKHMGDKINTISTDFSPFLAADGKTFYFASWDLPGYGSADMFVSKRLDETWTNWSEPKNLGPAVNDYDFNAYYTISTDGETVIYISGTNSLGWTDIFMSETPEEIKPDPVLIVRGNVFNSKTNEPISAAINYFPLLGEGNLGQTISDPTTGFYSIVLPLGLDMGFLAHTDKFLSVSDNVLKDDIDERGGVITRDLYLTPIEVGVTVRLNNVFFDFNKSMLKEESFHELDRLVNILNQNPNMVIELRGHTDNIGDNNYNLSLSNSRARAVQDYLLKKNIKQERLSSKGFGETTPVATNDTEEGRELNRRVEFYIVKN